MAGDFSTKYSHLKADVLVPSDAAYVASEESIWSKTARVGPACIIRPSTVEQVAETLKALVDSGEKFAVRSGGHAPGAGLNNIKNGVTIDLSLLDHVRYDPASETVSFGPGVRWKHVYGEVEKHGRVINGGREANTGVAGLLLGGGISWMAARYGWACDTVVTFQVVLANGSIVTADKDTNKDLFKGLKGGWNNLGIVTDFTLRTFPNPNVWGGLIVSPKSSIPTLLPALERFTSDIPRNPDSSVIIAIGYIAPLKDIFVTNALVETRQVKDSPSFKEWLSLPDKISNSTANKTVLELASDVALPQEYYNTWFTLTIKNDKRLTEKAVELHEALVQEVLAQVPDGNFFTQLLLQPLPTLYAQNSVAAGGNVLGLERNKEDGLILSLNAMMATAEQDAFVYPKVKKAIDSLRDFASSLDGGGLLDWIYVNYADASQDAIPGYGPENVRFLTEVASKYDPDHVFQKLCEGGFKLPKTA